MEVDTGSSSFSMIRSTSKRTRSPESPSPVDRPAKRFTFDLESRSHTPASEVGSLLDGGWQSGPVHRNPEEWVTRTGSLNLDNPQGMHTHQQHQQPNTAVSAMGSAQHDMDVSMDMDEGTPIHAQVHLNHIVSPLNAVQGQAPSPYHPVFPPFAPTPSAPIIHSAPPTTSTFANTSTRFRMGPRTDCEKCRLGVPGHYAHF